MPRRIERFAGRLELDRGAGLGDSEVVGREPRAVHAGERHQIGGIEYGEQALANLSAAVPFAPDDLPGYGGRLFDHLVQDPAVLRLSTWANLERPEAHSGEIGAYRPKINALRDHFDANATDLLALPLGLVTAWFNASPSLQSLADEVLWSRGRPATHCGAMVAAIAALCAEIGRPRNR